MGAIPRFSILTVTSFFSRDTLKALQYNVYPIIRCAWSALVRSASVSVLLNIFASNIHVAWVVLIASLTSSAPLLDDGFHNPSCNCGYTSPPIGHLRQFS